MGATLQTQEYLVPSHGTLTIKSLSGLSRKPKYNTDIAKMKKISADLLPETPQKLVPLQYNTSVQE